MKFNEKLRQLRAQLGLTQGAIAQRLGVSLRTYQNYEMGKMYPKQTEVYGKMAKLFNVSADYLLDDKDIYVMEASKKGGKEAMEDVDSLLSHITALFAGGTLCEEDKDKVMATVNELYWQSRGK